MYIYKSINSKRERHSHKAFDCSVAVALFAKGTPQSYSIARPTHVGFNLKASAQLQRGSPT